MVGESPRGGQTPDENHSLQNPEQFVVKPVGSRLWSSSSTATPSPKAGHPPRKPLIESMAKALGIDSETLNIFLAI